MAAVQNHGHSRLLEYASTTLQNDPEIILEAAAGIKRYAERVGEYLESQIWRSIPPAQKNKLIMHINNIFAYNQFSCKNPRQHNAEHIPDDVMRKVGDFLGVRIDKERQLDLARSVYRLFPGPRQNSVPVFQFQTQQLQAAEETPATLSLSR